MKEKHHRRTLHLINPSMYIHPECHHFTVVNVGASSHRSISFRCDILCETLHQQDCFCSSFIKEFVRCPEMHEELGINYYDQFKKKQETVVAPGSRR